MGSASLHEYPHAKECGQRIKTLRKRRRMTTAELGKMTGISQQQISAIERGIVTTPIENLALIAKRLGTSLAVLLTTEAFKQLIASPPPHVPTLARELATACLEAPGKPVPEALLVFAQALLDHPRQRGQ